MNVLKRIEELRNAKGWSKAELAKRSDLSRSTITMWSTRNNRPSVSSLLSVCKAFEITLSEFYAAEINAKSYNTSEEDELLDYLKNLNSEEKDALLVLSRRNKI